MMSGARSSASTERANAQLALMVFAGVQMPGAAAVCAQGLCVRGEYHSQSRSARAARVRRGSGHTGRRHGPHAAPRVSALSSLVRTVRSHSD